MMRLIVILTSTVIVLSFYSIYYFEYVLPYEEEYVCYAEVEESWRFDMCGRGALFDTHLLADGLIRIDNKLVSKKQFGENVKRLAECYGNGPHWAMHVDKSVRMDSVKEVVETLLKYGIYRISYVTKVK